MLHLINRQLKNQPISNVTILQIAILFTGLLYLYCPCGPVIAKPSETNGYQELYEIFDMSLEELMDVNITVASKKPEYHFQAPGVVSVVGHEEITIFGDRNLDQLMQRQPSVYTRSSFEYADNHAAFRGDLSTHTEKHTLILFNGRPIRESAQGINTNLYVGLPLSSLESVELIRGPGSVLYGSNAFTGVINLKSRAIPDQYEFAISGMGGSNGYYDTTFSGGGKKGDLGVVADIRATGEHGYTYSMFDAFGTYGQDNKHSKNISGTAHLEYKNFTLDFFGSDLNAFAMGILPFWLNNSHEIRNKKYFINAGYRMSLHKRMDLEFNATYNLQENVLSCPASQMIGYNTSDFLGEVTLFTRPTDNSNFLIGYLHEYRSSYKPNDSYMQVIPTYHYYPASAYAQGDYKITESLKLIAGTQWNRTSQDLSDFVSRFGLIYTPFKKWGLKFLYGEAFRAPVAMETDSNNPLGLVGNPGLEPETIATYDLQLFYHAEKTYAAVTYFNSTVKNMIIYNLSVYPYTFINSGTHKFEGIEFEAKQFIKSGWHILGSFMYKSDTETTSMSTSVVPDVMAKLGIGYQWSKGSASVFCTYFGCPPEIASPRIVNPEPRAVGLVSMNLRMDISENLGLKKGKTILTIRGENLLNEKTYAPTLIYISHPNSFPYANGATFFAGLTYNFQ